MNGRDLCRHDLKEYNHTVDCINAIAEHKHLFVFSRHSIYNHVIESKWLTNSFHHIVVLMKTCRHREDIYKSNGRVERTITFLL